MRDLEYVACPLCGSGDSTEELRAMDFLYSREEFVVTRCDKCGLGYTNPRIRESRIADYYFSGYATRGSEKSAQGVRRFVMKAARIAGDANREVLTELQSAGARSILEIGPGGGTLLRYLRAHDFVVAGIETDRDCARALREDGIACRDGRLEDVVEELKPRSFDAVILCHVFEHLYRPRETLEHIRTLLHEMGIIYLTLPDWASMEARIFGKYWRGLDLPRHVIHYERGKIETLLASSGFKIVKAGHCVFPSSFVESIGFLVLRGKRMPSSLYYPLYYLWKLLCPIHLKLMGSGVMRIVARRT